MQSHIRGDRIRFYLCSTTWHGMVRRDNSKHCEPSLSLPLPPTFSLSLPFDPPHTSHTHTHTHAQRQLQLNSSSDTQKKTRQYCGKNFLCPELRVFFLLASHGIFYMHTTPYFTVTTNRTCTRAYTHTRTRTHTHTHTCNISQLHVPLGNGRFPDGISGRVPIPSRVWNEGEVNQVLDAGMNYAHLHILMNGWMKEEWMIPWSNELQR